MANIKLMMVLVFSNTFFTISFQAVIMGIAMKREGGTDLVASHKLEYWSNKWSWLATVIATFLHNWHIFSSQSLQQPCEPKSVTLKMEELQNNTVQEPKDQLLIFFTLLLINCINVILQNFTLQFKKKKLNLCKSWKVNTWKNKNKNEFKLRLKDEKLHACYYSGIRIFMSLTSNTRLQSVKHISENTGNCPH